MRVAISASEYWTPAGEFTAPDEALVGRFSGAVVVTGGAKVEDDLVSVSRAV
jgi:hypothetical protein